MFPKVSTLQRGLTLIDSLVGMAVGLVVALIIAQVMAAFEGQKRTTTSTSDTIESGDVALYMVEREVRMAGYGINTASLFGCRVEANDNTQGGAVPNLAFNLVPITITQGAAGAPDTVAVLYGSNDGFGNASLFNPSSATQVIALNRGGVFLGDLLVLSGTGTDGNLATPPANGVVCMLAEATVLPTAAGQTDIITFNGTNYLNAAGVMTTPTHNPGAAIGVTITGTGSMLDMGPSPRWVTYSVTTSADGNHYSLQAAERFSNTTATVADDIINLQAQYGLDNGANNGTLSHAVYNADDGIIDEFVDTLPATPTATDYSRVMAVRVALLARSKQVEKPNPTTGLCTTTTAAPTWGGGTAFVMAGANWGCYHYRVFETTVPLRNVIWKQ